MTGTSGSQEPAAARCRPRPRHTPVGDAHTPPHVKNDAVGGASGAGAGDGRSREGARHDVGNSHSHWQGQLFVPTSNEGPGDSTPAPSRTHQRVEAALPVQPARDRQRHVDAGAGAAASASAAVADGAAGGREGQGLWPSTVASEARAAFLAARAAHPPSPPRASSGGKGNPTGTGGRSPGDAEEPFCETRCRFCGYTSSRPSQVWNSGAWEHSKFRGQGKNARFAVGAAVKFLSHKQECGLAPFLCLTCALWRCCNVLVHVS